MLGVVRNTLPVTTLCLEQRKAAAQQSGFVEEIVSAEDAKAPWEAKEYSDTAAAASKSKSREALLRLLSKSGVSSAAQKMALDILMKLVVREKFDWFLFEKTICAVVENRGVGAEDLLDYWIHRYLLVEHTRYHASIIVNRLCSQEYEYLCERDADSNKSLGALTLACEGALITLQKAALERDNRRDQNEVFVAARPQAMELAYVTDTDSSDCDCVRALLPSKTTASEDESGCCKANVGDNVLEEPEKQKTSEDISKMILSAARVRDSETTNASNAKAAAPKKKVEEDDEVDDEEGEDEGGESGGDEGDSDDPEQGGNEEVEEVEEEEEEEEEGEEDEGDDDGGLAQQQQQQLNLLNNINRNSAAYDEEDEENDGGVEDDGEGEEGAENDDDGEDDEDVGPPKKRTKKRDDEVEEEEDEDEDDEEDEAVPPKKKSKS